MGCNRETGQDNVIVINPSHTFQERLLGVTADSTPSASEIETLFLTTVVRTWRSYLDHMEQRLNRIVRSFFRGLCDETGQLMAIMATENQSFYLFLRSCHRRQSGSGRSGYHKVRREVDLCPAA